MVKVWSAPLNNEINACLAFNFFHRERKKLFSLKSVDFFHTTIFCEVGHPNKALVGLKVIFLLFERLYLLMKRHLSHVAKEGVAGTWFDTYCVVF